MKRWFVLVLFCCFWSALLAQRTDRVVQLLANLRSADTDTSKMDIYLALADEFAEFQPKKAANHANLALILAESKPDYRRQVAALVRLIELNRGPLDDLPTANALLYRAFDIPPNLISLRDRAALHGQRGLTGLETEAYDDALRDFEIQLGIAERLNDSKGVAQANFNLGLYADQTGRFRRAVNCYERALKLFTELPDDRATVRTLASLARTYAELREYEQMLYRSVEALMLAREGNLPVETGELQLLVGDANRMLRDTVKAIRNYASASRHAEEEQFPGLRSRAALELGKIALAACEEPAALDYLQTALRSARSSNDKRLQLAAYRGLFDFYDQTGEPVAAYDYLQQYTSMKDEIYAESRTRRLVIEQAKYESEQRRAENEQLRARELENRVTIQTQRTQMFGLIVIVFVVLGTILFLFYENRRKRAVNAELEEEVKRRTLEIERSNHELQQSNEKLEQSNSELERFAYIASHDLKSPLRNVISFINLIQRKVNTRYDDTDLQEYLKYAATSAKQMNHLIEDVLEFSRVSNAEAVRTEVDLNETLAGVMRNLGDEVQERDAEVFVQALPTVEANEVHLLQLLQNLIGNGIKYNRAERPRVLVQHREEEGEIVVSVADNGIGIAPEFHEQIFAMFKRLHTPDEYRGTGIGLALCKKIVDQLGGRIWLESEQGRGTTFYFSLPR